jgi:hypothetical protein
MPKNVIFSVKELDCWIQRSVGKLGALRRKFNLCLILVYYQLIILNPFRDAIWYWIKFRIYFIVITRRNKSISVICKRKAVLRPDRDKNGERGGSETLVVRLDYIRWCVGDSDWLYHWEHGSSSKLQSTVDLYAILSGMYGRVVSLWKILTQMFRLWRYCATATHTYHRLMIYTTNKL